MVAKKTLLWRWLCPSLVSGSNVLSHPICWGMWWLRHSALAQLLQKVAVHLLSHQELPSLISWYQHQQQMELQSRTWCYHPDSGSNSCSCDISCAWNNMQLMDYAELLNHFLLPVRPGTDISPNCILSGKINGCPPPLLTPSFLREQLSHHKEAVTSTGHQ